MTLFMMGNRPSSTKRYGGERSDVKDVVIGMEPETRKGRHFLGAESLPVFLADDQAVSGSEAWDMERKMVEVRRPEICDRSPEKIAAGKEMLSCRCEEMEIFVKECTNLGKVPEENDLGSRESRYRKTGQDHYRQERSFE